MPRKPKKQVHETFEACFEAFVRQVERRGNPELVYAVGILMETMKTTANEITAVDLCHGGGDGDGLGSDMPGAWVVSTMCRSGHVEEAREKMKTANDGLRTEEMVRYGLLEEGLWKDCATKMLEEKWVADKETLERVVGKCGWWREIFRRCQGGLCEDWGNVAKEDILMAIEDGEEVDKGRLVDDGILRKVVEAGMVRGWRKMEADAEALVRYSLSEGDESNRIKRMGLSVLVKDRLWLEEGSAADRFFGIGDMVWELRGWLFGEDEKREMDEVFFYGVENGQENVVGDILEMGADVNALDFEWRTALSIAASNGNESMCRLLLDRGAEANLCVAGWTPLHDASEKGHEAVCHLLLDRGAAVDVDDDDGYTPLHCASKNGLESVCRLLLDRGADVNLSINGKTPLHDASESGHESVCRLLLERGAEVDLANDDGKTPLMLAAEKGDEAVCRLFLESGADVNVATNDGATPLFLASLYERVSICRIL